MARVLTWHVHGSYLLYLSRLEHELVLPVRPGRPHPYGGRAGAFPWPDNVVEVPADEVRELDLDVVLYQSERAWRVDLADRSAAEEAVRVAAEGAVLRGLVTAAGIDACGRLEDVPAEDWERVVAVNLLGTAAVVRAALPRLEEAGGRVVTVASTLGLRGVSDATAYCASKFGVIGFTRALAAETAGRVGVTLLVPSGMQTSFFDGRDERYRPGPDAELADPAEVAEAVVFALTRPNGCEVRELLVAPARETSWP